MATSSTEIANLALTQIGATNISDLNATNANKNTKTAKRIYTQSLKEILREGAWNFAIKRDTLAQDTTAPAFEWSYRYALPSDYVAALTINGFDPHTTERGKQVIEDGYVLTDWATCKIKYVYLNTSPGTYGAHFTKAFVKLLAARLAAPIMGNASLGAQLEETYEEKTLPKALTKSARESRGHRIDRRLESDLVKCRSSRSIYFSD